MSGYRNLHREQVIPSSEVDENGDGKDAAAFWALACTGLGSGKQQASSQGSSFLIWTTGSWSASQQQQTPEDICHVRSYIVQDTSVEEKQASLEASALRLRPVHDCVDDIDERALGGSSLDVTRNYTGEDRSSGNLLMLSMDLSNVVRIWDLSTSAALAPEFLQTTMKSSQSTGLEQQKVPVRVRFHSKQATGTNAVFLPPRLVRQVDAKKNPIERVVSVAIGCLDGTIILVSTGIEIFNPHGASSEDGKSKRSLVIPEAGEILDTWGSVRSGSGGSSSGAAAAVPLTLVWNPTQPETLAVGSSDGLVHVMTRTAAGNSKHYRLNHLGQNNSIPTRAVAFTTDGHLLIAGNDQGRLCVWDCSQYSPSGQDRNDPKDHLMGAPALVHHMAEAHTSWIWRTVALDSRRFVTLGFDKKISVWNVGQMYQPLHTFHSDQSGWSLAMFSDDEIRTPNTLSRGKAPRLVTGSDTGCLQVFSLEAN